MARVDPEQFAIAAFTTDGTALGVGDVDSQFTIQSVSKLLAYGLALGTHGRDVVLERVGVAPTGDSFNAIVLDDEANRAPNPMVSRGILDDRVEETLDLYFAQCSVLVTADGYGNSVRGVRSMRGTSTGSPAHW